MTLSISFEVFPPKSADGFDALRSTVGRLGEARPAFVSVTYGAGGSDRERSFAAIDAVRSAGFDVAGHITCVGQSRSDVDAVIDRYSALGVTQIVALRGDPPSGVGAPYEPHADGYQRTADLVATIKQRGGFGVAVSGLSRASPPIPHRRPRSGRARREGRRRRGQGDDADVLRQRPLPPLPRSGAGVRHQHSDRARHLSHPFVSRGGAVRRAMRCIDPIADRRPFAGLDDDAEATRLVAAELAAAQINELAAHGVEEVHIYTLNRADLAIAVCQRLGVASRVVAA